MLTIYLQYSTKINENLNNFINHLNSFYSSIKFTHEIESNNSIPFLDILVIKNTISKRLEFDIYRKPTHTDCFITNDSNHPPTQKRAVFHSLIYRSQEKFKKELQYIKDVAFFNGYKTDLVEHIFKKAKKKHDKKSKTTLLPIKDTKTNWISTTWTNISKDVQKSFKKHKYKRHI
ncbi:hypothetical protein J6590_108837 [Homalodisca vitripennis]|nr:hypothetical protein J6590_108837 [Homalodisca vitripennis]